MSQQTGSQNDLCLNGSKSLDALLVALPWAKADHMSIQVGGLKAALVATGLSAGARHYYRDIIDFVPLPVVDALFESRAGEHLSLWHLWEESRLTAEASAERAVGHLIGTRDLLNRYSNFLESVLDDIVRLAVPGHTLVGFTTSLQQIATSLLVAKKLKERDCNYRIVFGGAILQERNARDVLSAFSEIDYIIYGEGEEALVQLCRQVAAPESKSLEAIPNLVYRMEGRIVANRHAEMASLAKLPVPDYSDYFDFRLNEDALDLYPKIAVETSRGCFYDKCTFCNLNAQWIARYRAKSDEQVHAELISQVRRCQTTRILFVDTNISNRKSLFDRMQRDSIQYHAWGEVSGHLTRSAFSSMRAAGVQEIQIGIESFSPALLKNFKKGVTAMRNMELLKWCSEMDFNLFYNLMVNYPGETQTDADITLKAIEYARYYQPPAISDFMMTIDSPLERALRESGRLDLIPQGYDETLMSMVPPDKHGILIPLMSTFVGSGIQKSGVDWSGVFTAVRQWQTAYGNTRKPSLTMRKGDGFLVITDSYGGELGFHKLLGLEAEVYLACMVEARSVSQIAKTIGYDETVVELELMRLHQLGLLYYSDSLYLALAVWEDRHVKRSVETNQAATMESRSVSPPLADTTLIQLRQADLGKGNQLEHPKACNVHPEFRLDI